MVGTIRDQDIRGRKDSTMTFTGGLIRFSTWCMLLSLTCRSSAQTVKCPAPRNLFKATVKASVTFDPNTNLYTYEYTVTSDSSSRQEINAVAVDFAPPLKNVTHPRGWAAMPFAGRNTMVWAAIAAAALPAGTRDTGQVPPSLFPIRPGNSLAGFSFQSANPPGPVNSYALGSAPLGVADSEAGAEAIAESCPQSVGGFFDLATVGTTQGPAPFIPVQISIRPGSSPKTINPGAQEAIPVAILSSPSFDARTADPATIRLGPAGAAPTGETRVADANNDGIPDLILQFPSAAAGVVCGDTSVTLTGKTLSGKSIQGSEPIVTVDCKK